MGVNQADGTTDVLNISENEGTTKHNPMIRGDSEAAAAIEII